MTFFLPPQPFDKAADNRWDKVSESKTMDSADQSSLRDGEKTFGSTYNLTRIQATSLHATPARVMLSPQSEVIPMEPPDGAESWTSTNTEDRMWSAMTVEEYNERKDVLMEMLPGKIRMLRWHQHNVSKTAQDALFQLAYRQLKMHAKTSRNKVIMLTYKPTMDNVAMRQLQGKAAWFSSRATTGLTAWRRKQCVCSS